VFTSAVGPAAASAALTATYPSSPSHSSSATLPSPQLLEMSAVRVSKCVDGNEANGSSLQRERERGGESQVLYIFVIMQRCRYVCVLYTNRHIIYSHLCTHKHTHTRTLASRPRHPQNRQAACPASDRLLCVCTGSSCPAGSAS
jgi:hypothetical protein